MKTPKLIIKYLSIEFLKSLLMIFLIFLSLSLLINFVEELIFFKDKKIDDFLFMIIYLTLCKTPNTIIELIIFIFLFSGILFFVKIIKSNEINTIKLSGLTNLLVVLTPAIVSFLIGIFIIFGFTPFSAATTNFYEKTKRLYSQNENLIVINGSGLWFMESTKDGYNIIRADKINDNNFLKLNNITIYNMDLDFNFKKRYDATAVDIYNKDWNLKNVSILEFIEQNKESKQLNDFTEMKFISTININDLKDYFTNANTISFLNILKNIKKLNQRGYSADELKIKLHKYISLPIYLFSMIILSTLFTINIKKDLNNFIYIFLGIIVGIIIYFLNDLSIAIGVSNKVPLELSVWMPVLLIIFLSSINLIKINDK